MTTLTRRSAVECQWQLGKRRRECCWGFSLVLFISRQKTGPNTVSLRYSEVHDHGVCLCVIRSEMNEENTDYEAENWTCRLVLRVQWCVCVEIVLACLSLS